MKTKFNGILMLLLALVVQFSFAQENQFLERSQINLLFHFRELI